MDDASKPLGAQELLPGHEDIKPFMGEAAKRICMRGTISEASNGQITLKLSNLPNFFTVGSINVLLKQSAHLNVDRSIYYVEAFSDENGRSNGVFLIRFLRPLDARVVRFRLNNRVLHGKLITVQVEDKNNASTVITPEFENRFEHFLISEQARISRRLMEVQKQRLQETLAPQSTAAYDPAIEAELKALLKTIDELIQPRSTNMVEDNVEIEKTAGGSYQVKTTAESDDDDDSLESGEYISEAETFKLSSDSDGSVDCEELSEKNTDAEEQQPNNDIQDGISVTNSKDQSNDMTNVNQESLDDSDSENKDACHNKEDINKNKESSKVEIKWELKDVQETHDDHDKTRNDSYANLQGINNKSDENTVANEISSIDSTDGARTNSTEIIKTVTSDSYIPISAKRKLDSIDVDSTAFKKSISNVSHCGSTQDDSRVFVDNVRLPNARGRAKKDYGLNHDFLDYLGLKLPLSYRISVNGLYENVNETKLREVFSMAGKIRKIQIKNNNTAEILYDHPVEAVQANSMFDKRKLYDKGMHVSMEYSDEVLPPGLSSIGRGFAPNGAPLLHVGAIAEQTEINEILWEMGRMRKTQLKIKNSPFSYIYANKAKNSENCEKTSEESNESTSVFRFSVPGTGEPDERPSNNSESALKELNKILKDRGLIPENVECKKVKDILSWLKSKTIVTNQSQVPVEVNNMANTTVSMSNSIKCTSDVGSNTLNVSKPTNGQKPQKNNTCTIQKINQQLPQTRQNVVFSKNIPQTKNLPRPPIPPMKNPRRPLLPILYRPPFMPTPPCIPMQFHPNFRPFGPEMMNTQRFQHNVHRYSMYRNIGPQYGREGGQGAFTLIFENLPRRISEQILSQKMFEIGDPDFCKMIGLGRAVVRFQNPQDSHRCKQIFDKSTLDGNIIDVFYE